MENIEWFGLSYLALAYTYESLNHKKVGTAAHVRLKPQIPSKVKNKVHWEKNQVDAGHECNYELNGPNAVAGWTVTWSRVVSKHKNWPHDSGKDIQHNRDH